MKTVLVTGANGFIGTALVKNLEQRGFNVIKYVSSMGSIVDFDFINEYYYIKIDHIFHLASKTFIPDSWSNPMSFYKVAVIGTENILELCRKQNISMTFVSAYLYGEPKQLPISESDYPRPNNPYAHSKYLAEDLCKFYSNFYNVKVVIARPFNIYGKGQNEEFLIPSIIRQALNTKVIKVRDLHPKRDYIYLDDLIDGLIKTLNTSNHLSVYNFGFGSSISVENIINTVQKIIKSNKRVESAEMERKNEIMDVVADITKAQEELNWHPKINLEDGIKLILGESNEKHTNK
jgi:nucleoside-diphosphate-sugar epimerase